LLYLRVMRTLLLGLVLMATACTGGAPGGGGGGGGTEPDAPTGMMANCPLPATTADAGSLPALKAQRCGVPQSGGAKWYRLSATLASGDIVQLELWPASGAFTAAVTTGTFTIQGVETDYAKCGVCLRAIGDKGTATAKEYFGTGGTVNVTALGINGQPISATITNATFAEIETTGHTKVANGCTASVGHLKVDGTVMDVGGTGGGGGGGGGGGAQCAPGVGD
jgi:hypothetical protein